jgi:fibro-slime domain-containing protein
MHPNHVIHGSSQNRVRPTDSPRPTPRGIGQGEPRRRGMAVLLALIAVSLAIIIGLALASNRDATSATSSSIVRVASARTAAAGSLDIATRILELNTSIAAGDASDSTRLLCLPATVGGATVSARMTDMLTGMSPTSKTLAVAIVASATIDDVTQETRAVGRVPWASNVARADLDLSEFALAAHGDIAISDGSVVGVWKTAPMAALGEPIVIGTSTRDAIAVDPNAVTHGVSLATPGNFPESLAEADEQLAEGEFAIPAELHMPAAPFPPLPGAAMEISPDDLTTLSTVLAAYEMDGGVIPTLELESEGGESLPIEILPDLEGHLVPAPVVVGVGGKSLAAPSAKPSDVSTDIVVTSSLDLTSMSFDITGTIVEGGWRSVHVLGDLVLSGTTLNVDVPTLIAVYGDLTIDDTSKIALADRCKLTIYVLGDTEVTGSSYIGPDDVALPANRLGSLSYHPERVVIYAQPQSNVTIGDGSVVVGEIYGPDARIAVRQLAALYGRACGAEIEVDAGRIFYDPALDSARGYRNPASGLWAKPNVLREEVRTVEVLDDVSLATFTEATGVVADAPTVMTTNAHVDATGGVDDVRTVGPLTTTVTPEFATSLALSAAMTEFVEGGEPEEVEFTGEMPSGSAGSPDSFVLYGTLRDFRTNEKDAGKSGFPGVNSSLEAGKIWKMTHEALDHEGKPVLHDPIRGRVETDFTTSEGEPIAWTMFDGALGDQPGSEAPGLIKSLTHDSKFKAWFRDVDGENLSEATKILFERIDDGGGSSYYVFSSESLPSGGYYPADGRLFGNPPDKATKKPTPHNYHFTVEFTATLTYSATTPQWMIFGASDDLWVYVNGELVVDLGGFGEARKQYLRIDRLAAREGWSEGSQHDIRIFMANRSMSESYLLLMSNFALGDGSSPVITKPTAYLKSLQVAQAQIEDEELTSVFPPITTPVFSGFKRR